MAKKEVLNNDVVTLRVGEPVTEVLEEASNTVEQSLDILENQVEKVVTVTKNNPLILAGVFVVGVGIGGFVAYKVAQKRLEAKFEAELTEQIEAARSFHTRLAKEGEFVSPESAVQALVPEEVVEAVQSYQGRGEKVPYNKPDEVVEETPDVEVTVQAEVTEVTNNVFVQAKADPRDWDYRLEIADREANPDQPYVISFDEFNENSEGHEQANMTYYVRDDTLADDKDQIVDNTDYVVGDDNLLRFGHGSGDNNVVYVRNEKISMDFEIVKSRGSYQKDVLGFEPDTSLRHSSRRPANRRFRGTDE